MFIGFVDFVAHLCYHTCMTTPLMLQVSDGGQVITLRGRAAAIVWWIVDRAERLNSQRRVKLEFDCAGCKVRPKCMVFEDEAPITVG